MVEGYKFPVAKSRAIVRNDKGVYVKAEEVKEVKAPAPKPEKEVKK